MTDHEKPRFEITLTPKDSEQLGSTACDIIEKALAAKTPTKNHVIDAAETAKRGDFLKVPEFICRGIE